MGEERSGGGKVRIRRGRRDEAVRLEEVDPETAAPILKEYIRNVPIVRPYFDVTVDSPREAFIAEAPRHPAFRIVAKGSAKNDVRLRHAEISLGKAGTVGAVGLVIAGLSCAALLWLRPNPAWVVFVAGGSRLVLSTIGV